MTARPFLAIRSVIWLLPCLGAFVFAAPAGATCLSLGGGEPPMVGVAALNTPGDPIVSVDVWVQGPAEAEATSWTNIPVTVEGEFATGTSVFGDDGNARGTRLQVKEFIHKSGKRTPAPTNPQVVWEERVVECDAAPKIPLDEAQPATEDRPPATQSTEHAPNRWYWRAAALAAPILIASGFVITRRRSKVNDEGFIEMWNEKVQPGEEMDGSEQVVPEGEAGYDNRRLFKDWSTGEPKPALPESADTAGPASENAPPPPADEPSILDEIDEGAGPPGLA